jgi:hypothetical protein
MRLSVGGFKAQRGRQICDETVHTVAPLKMGYLHHAESLMMPNMGRHCLRYADWCCLKVDAMLIQLGRALEGR